MPPKRKSRPRSPRHAALGQAIELAIRERGGVSQEQVAREAGLDVRQVSALVCGQSNPTYLTLLRLCEGLHIPLSQLIARAEELEATAAGHEGSQGPAHGSAA